MADDRFDPPEPAPEEDGPLMTAEEAEWGERWLAENHDWVKAKVQEALDDPRPALSEAEMNASLEALFRELEANEAT